MAVTIERYRINTGGSANGIAWAVLDLSAEDAATVTGIGGWAQVAPGTGSVVPDGGNPCYTGGGSNDEGDTADDIGLTDFGAVPRADFPLIATLPGYDAEGRIWWYVGFRCPPNVRILTHLWVSRVTD